MKEFKIIKSKGHKEPFDPEKITERTLLACDGISGVSPSQIEMNASLNIENNMTTRDIQKALVTAAAELISEETPNYEYAAANLLNQQIRKEVYGQYNPKDFLQQVKKRVKDGIYDPIILEQYTDEEIEYFGKKLRYQRDEKFTYAGLQQLASKYLISKDGKLQETPQEIFMLMNMYIFASYKELYDIKVRNRWILEGYRILSTHEASLPTPIMNGLRTRYRRFISCNLIDAGDTVKSLSAANAAIMEMTANKSGLGISACDIRGLGADIGNGRVKHTGILPILQAFQASTKAFTQVGRGGASSISYVFYHYEADLILELGNAKGTEDTRVRHADHTIVFNKLFFDRVKEDGDITLFHINEVPKLNDLIGKPEFHDMYRYYEKTVPNKHKRTIKARDYLNKFLNERFLQGRLYFTFADNADHQGPWKIPVYVSNLCLEILVPIAPLDQDNAEIGVCILAAMNHGKVTDERVPVVSEWLVRFLDLMIDYMDYSSEYIEKPAKLRRTLGIGDSDVFHYLAKNKMFYNTEEGRNFIHRRKELMSYHLHRTSIQLAKDFGPCEKIADTKYDDGWLPIDSYNKNTDELISQELLCDWEGLRKDLIKYKQRNSTLMAIAPVANSAKPSGSTSGIEPPRFLATTKEDKTIITQLVPSYISLKNYYTTAWSPEFNNIDYIKFVSLFQKFTDQSMSTNQYTELSRYEDGKVPIKVLQEEFVCAYRYGLKTMYYQNTRAVSNKDGLDETVDACGSGGCSI